MPSLLQKLDNQIQSLLNRRETIISKSLFECILNSVNVGLVVTDNKGEFLIFNPKAQKILGLGPASGGYEKWNSTYGLYYPDKDELIPTHELPLVRALYGETRDQFKIRLIRQDQKSPEYISVSANPIIDKNGAQTGAVAVFRDITESQRLFEQLSQSQKMEAVGRLAGGIAHDFNNKLGTILLTCDYLLNKTQDFITNELLGNIHTVATNASVLTKKLLAYSRKQVIRPQIIDLNEQIKSNEKILAKLLAENVRLTIESASFPAYVKVDPLQLDQVILNLIINAKEAMPNGGTLSITVSLETIVKNNVSSAFAVVTVTDSGTGIDPEILKKIFEPFFTTKSPFERSGLGLPLVEGIVHQHGGEITVQSQVNQGTTFKIYFPTVEKHAVENGTGQTPSRFSKTPQETKILLVDDDELLAYMTSEILREEGYQVIRASQAQTALKLLATNPDVHLLLTDIIMPGMNGCKLANLVSEKNPEIRVLYMSGYPEDIIQEQGVQTSELHFLQKPVSKKTLLLAVQEALKQPAENLKS